MPQLEAVSKAMEGPGSPASVGGVDEPIIFFSSLPSWPGLWGEGEGGERMSRDEQRSACWSKMGWVGKAPVAFGQ